MTETSPSSSAPTLQWDWGTAYELFISLHVLHEPEHYEVRAAWAAGIRSRIPAAERKFLEEVLPFLGMPLCWIQRLPQPKDAITALWALRQLPPEKRVSILMCLDERDEPEAKVLTHIAESRAWGKEDLAALSMYQDKVKSEHDSVSLERCLDWWARPAEFGEMLLSALQAYYQAFFEEEEKRVAPVLQAGLERAQVLAGRVSISELITELSQGIHLEELKFSEMILVPAYWTTPLVVFEHIGKEKMLFLFGARPANMAAIPGEAVPDALIRTLKALADPTRLKILHFIQERPFTPSELARKLRLRAPTVTHHLNELRLAGLVHMNIKGQERLYTTRLEALDAACGQLKDFLQSPQA
jgi:DNA-binding transcriptional ArsR family regulator